MDSATLHAAMQGSSQVPVQTLELRKNQMLIWPSCGKGNETATLPTDLTLVVQHFVSSLRHTRCMTRPGALAQHAVCVQAVNM